MKNNVKSFFCLLCFCLCMTAVLPSYAQGDGQVPAIETDLENNKIVLTVSGVYGAEKLLIPVWTEENGQDDVFWYTGTKLNDSTWMVEVDPEKHGYTSGEYNVHLYNQLSSGELVFIAGQKLSVSLKLSGTMTVIDKNDKFGTCTIRISDICAPFKISEIYIPTWSDVNGQDDVVWYTAKYNNGIWSADIDVSDHNGDTGNYIMHMYYSDESGNFSYVGHITENIQATAVKDRLLEAAVDKNTGKVRINLGGNYASAETVYFPMWSSVNGQDDVVWYEAVKKGNSLWRAEADLKDHNYDSGRYDIHAYVKKTDGTMEFIKNASFDVGYIFGGNIAVTDKDMKNGTFGIQIQDVHMPFNGELMAAIWSENGGQDDIKWYKASQNASGYAIAVDMGTHAYDTGKYNVHVYCTDNGEKYYWVGAISDDMNMLEADVTEKKASSMFQIEDTEASSGQFKVSISDDVIPGTIKSVLFPVWTENNGQDDTRWYEAVKDGDRWTAVVRAALHGNESGKYNIHCYVTNQNDEMICVGGTYKNVKVTQVSDGGLSRYVVAPAWVVYDLNNSSILYSRNPDATLQLASQTKIMTAMVVLEHVSDLNATVNMTWSAKSGMTWDTTMAGLVVGRPYTIRTLLEGLLVYSGGDCAGLLAEYVAGSREAFVALMNQKAVQLGMSGTYFSDPVGLYDNHTTPREYTKLLKYADQNATFREITAKPSCVVADVTGAYAKNLRSTNNLITGSVAYDHSLYTVDGMKTGTTDEAGYCFTASASNASGKRYAVAVFRSSSYVQRAVDARTLLNAAFTR